MRRYYFLSTLAFITFAGSYILYEGIDLSHNYSQYLSAEISQSALELRRIPEAVIRPRVSRLVFVGDVMLGRGVAMQIEKSRDARYPFLLIENFLRPYDIVFGNLEGPISDRGSNRGSIYSFRAPPGVIEGLKFAGFDVLSLANHHIWDWGEPALLDTLKLLKDNGIMPIGAGENEEEANKLHILEDDGTKFGFLAYTSLYPKSLEATPTKPGISHFNAEKIIEAIKDAKPKVDVLIVSLHWGVEYRTKATDEQRKIAHALIDAGADLVAGHHPHVQEEVEQYRGGWIAYSLGNFVFDQNFSPETKEGLMLTVTLENGKVRKVKTKKVSFSRTYQPYLQYLTE